ncbi:hypothetical protein RD792_003037 [Penstemon davidsonii]|uniref:Uncharacterized protein n=1 Tax=Penstemon davidsonii TaxID=160366 RepID=A0ABR0DTP2_9LAMI|nr:hypothetical protein RD792_003037 [Penstemon davidsonii]
MKNSSSLPLNECRILKKNLIINRLHILFNAIAIIALFYYRATTLLHIIKTNEIPLLPYVVVCFSEIVLTFIWILRRPARWRPVKRTVYPERLPEDEKLPPVDVFICTADPSKEPAFGVMNTVVSAMALDYPADKLAVYLSDDGGSYVTLDAMREAWKFGKWWVPFCKKYNLKIRCPQAYFQSGGNEIGAEEIEIKKRYDEFKENLEKNSKNASSSVSRDHPPTIEVMNQEDMPFLVYVAREKRPAHPHHFKGGALNVLLRVSAMISNAPYFIVLDCDHYCNDPTSARQAMCFYFDSSISQKLAWVQFPQKFHNASQHDIYGSRLHAIWREGLGLDGIKGPSIYGCNFYMSREAIYGTEKIHKGTVNLFFFDVDLNHLKKSFGSSNEFIKSIYKSYKPNVSRGEKVGYAYFSVVEDSITSLDLHCKGWISVFVDPSRPCFLGSATTNLNDMLVQQTRWAFGLMQIGLSKYCPLLYGIGRMSIFQCLAYTAHCMGDTLYVFPFYGLGFIPQICLLHNIPLYPKVSDPFFIVFAFIFLASLLKHAQEVLSYGDSFMEVLYELRAWMMKSTSSCLYATLNAVLDRIGLHEADFSLTNKAGDDEQARLFEKGLYDFQVSPLLLVPCCSLYILNLVSFIIGLAVIFQSQKANEMFIQAFIPFFVIIVNYQWLDGMIFRKDKGRIAPSVTLLSTAISSIILSLGYLFLIY